MENLVNNLKKHAEIETKIIALEKNIELKKIEQRLKTLINNRDIDAALVMYKEIQLPGINIFLIDEINRSIQFKNFERIHKILTNSKESPIFTNLKENVRNFMIDEYRLNDITMDQFINIIKTYEKYIDFEDLMGDIIKNKRERFMKMSSCDVLEIDRWIETCIKMKNYGLIETSLFEQGYVKHELIYVNMVKEKKLIRTENEKEYFIERVERRWKKYGCGSLRKEMNELFADIIVQSNSK